MALCSLYLWFKFRSNRSSSFPVGAFSELLWREKLASGSDRSWPNFYISETAGSILLKFAGYVAHRIVVWCVEFHECGFKFDGGREQTKSVNLNFWKFISLAILMIKFQNWVLHKAGVCGHLIAHNILYYCVWCWNYWIKTKRDHILKIGFLK